MTSPELYVAPDRCLSPWCLDCRPFYNRRVQKQVFDVLRHWGPCHHVTLTLDPKLFSDPVEAFEHIRHKHAISELFKSLRRKRLVVDHGYWGALHFHQNGWPHWHFIVQADYLLEHHVQSSWNNYSPSKGRSMGNVCVVPVGQSISSSAVPNPSSFTPYEPSPAHPGLDLPPLHLRTREQDLLALISYVLQDYWEHRRDDLPEWIWDHPDRIQRILHGHGLFPDAADRKNQPAAYGRSQGRKLAKGWRHKSLAQRHGRCGSSCVLLDKEGNFQGRIKKPAAVVMAEQEAAKAVAWQHLVALPVDIEETQPLLLALTG